MTLAHPLPWWVLVALVAAALLLAWRTYGGPAVPLTGNQRLGLTALRALTLLLLVLFLLRPVVFERGTEPRDVVVPVLVDVSRSMGLPDAEGETRLARARAMVERLLPALGTEFQVELLAFGDGVQEASPEGLEASAGRSDLQGALGAIRDRHQGRTIAGIVLVSDGGDTGGEEASQTVSPDAPIFGVGVGARRISRDREVTALTVGEAPLAGSVVELAASVVSRGYGTAPIEVSVQENGRPVQVRRVVPSADGSPVRVVFQVSPGADAATLYTVEVAADVGELTVANNRRSAVVQPPGRPRRLLLVEGRPGFEHSFLKRALGGDAGLEVDAVVRKGQNERGEETYYVQAAETRAAALVGGYPATRTALFGYDAVVLANLDASSLTRDQLAMTAAFVAERGGGLLVMGAESFEHQSLLRTPLEEVVPVELADRAGLAARAGLHPEGERFGLFLTPDGDRHPVMHLGGTVEDSARRWAAAPALASSAAVGGPRAGAIVLAESQGAGGVTRPLVAVQRYGEGRSMMFAGEAAWRWKMMLPADDGLYETFWRQAARWLAGDAPDPVALAAPPAALPGDILPLVLTVRNADFEAVTDASVLMTVAGPGGLERDVHVSPVEGAAGRYVGRFQAERAGLHRVRAEARRGDTMLGAAGAVVLVGGVDQEMADPRRNDEVLRRLAMASGGELLEPDALDGLAAHLAARAPDRLPPVPRDVWHSAWSFLLIVAMLGTEWGVRRRWGMR